MNTTVKLVGALLLLAAVAVALVGCEDTPLTAPGDSQVAVFANPSTLVIDPNVQQPDPGTGRFNVQSKLTAQLTSGEGRPLQGVSVSFTSSAGSLASAGNPVETDSSGTARDTLTLNDADPQEITISASSAAVNGTAMITKTVIGENELPRALVDFIPRNDENMDTIPDGQQGTTLTFDGSGSIDPDDTITCYKWEITSDNPDTGKNNPIIMQGPGVSGLNFIFNNEQTLAVNLRVSDKVETGNLCDPLAPPVPETLPSGAPAFSPFASLNQYQILCNNPAPTAVITGPTQLVVFGSPSTLTPVGLDGTLSFDGETAIDSWSWSCGNGTSPTNTSTGAPFSQVLCRYQALGDYTVTLQVRDKGTGTIDPGTGTFRCQKISEAATIIVSKQLPPTP